MEDKIIKTVIIVIGSFLLSYIVPRLIPVTKAKTKRNTVMSFLQHTVIIIVLFYSALTILSVYEIDITPFLLSSSIIGFAIGFGSQSLIKDAIAGIFLILEPQFKIGKKLKIGNYSGTVSKITLKNTYLKKDDGSLYIIPNGEIKVIEVID